MLTGQAKIDFAKWYNKFLEKNDYINNEFPIPFLTLPLSMQSGVYMEWLRSVGIIIAIQPEDIPNDYDQLFEVCIAISKATGLEWINVGFQLKHNLGLTQAIEKCNELINGEQK